MEQQTKTEHAAPIDRAVTRRGASCAAVLLIGTFLVSGVASAQAAEEAPAAEVSEEREFERPRPTAGEVLSAPLHLPEYLMRVALYPMRPLSAWAFQNQIPQRTIDAFSDDTRRIWAVPSAGYSSTNGFSTGGTFQYNDMFYEKKDLHVSGKLYTNWDRSASASFAKRASRGSPLLYRLGASYELDTDADFYGHGITSRREDKSVFTLERGTVTMSGGIRFYPLGDLRLVGRFGLLHAGTWSGNPDSSRPNVTTTFEGGELAGYGETTTWLRFGAALTYDSREPGGHPYQGKLLTVGADRYEDPDGEYGHWVLKARAEKLVDLHRQLNVLVLGLRFESVWDDPGGELPFHRLRSLDERHGLRGFPGGRFRDRRTLAGNIEYRFPIWRTVRTDPTFGLGVLFFDLGKPFDDLDSLARDGVRYSVGTGFVLTTRSRFLARAQLGYGGEGIETQISLGFAL